MSLNDQAFVKTQTEALNSGADPLDILEAITTIKRLRIQNAALERNLALACGRKGDTVAKINGLTDTLTQLLRRFAACGVVRYSDMEDLHRHVSALRKRLKELAPTVEIITLIGEGYELVRGYDDIYRLLRAGASESLRAPGFTPKQTAILSHLASRGSAHVDQINCLQRHMSNIRAKLKAMGHDKAIQIRTEAGDGLYTVVKGRDVLERIVAGEIAPEPKPAKVTALPAPKPQPKRKHKPAMEMAA